MADEPSVPQDRLLSPLCEKGEHWSCEHSSFIGICGCECHDHLDYLDMLAYGPVEEEQS